MWKRKQQWKLEQLFLFSRQLCNLLESGIPLITSLELLVEQCIIPGEAGSVIIAQLQQGKSFSVSLQEANFPNLFVSFIRAAEEHGDYIFGLSQCEAYFSSRDQWIREIKHACTYPFFVLLLVIVALFFMMTMVLPRFNELYITMGIELPWMTRLTLSLFHTISYVMWIFLFLLLGIPLYVLLRKWRKWEKEHWKKWIIRLPFLKSFFQYYFTHYFSIQLGSLLRSGVPLLVSLGVVEKYTPWPVLREYLEKVKIALLQGNSFYQAIEGNSSLFLSSFPMMIAIGEKSGRLDQSLLSLAKGTEQLLKAKMDRFVQSLEPMLIFFIGCFIALTVITMFLPMLQLVRAL